METRGEGIHIDTEDARAGNTPHILRYVLIVSLVLAIVALSAIWIAGALTDENPEGGGNEGANAAMQNGSAS